MNHEQLTTVNDTELATAVKESLTGVHMNIPLETIVSHGRKMRARRRIPGLAGTLAVIAAAAIAVTALPGHGANPAAPRAVELVADRAAASALSWPSVRPGQWVYREIEYYQTGYPNDGRDGTERTWTTAAWTPSDAGKGPYAIVHAGAIPYSELGSLPSDPAALEKYLGDRPNTSLGPLYPRIPSGRAEHAATAFKQIYGMLWDYALPPKLAAELFHALADVPGITVRLHATDAAGQHGVAFALPPAEFSGEYSGRRWRLEVGGELILNPSRYTLMAVGQTVILSVQKRPHGPVTITRSNTSQKAIVRQAYVSGPGIRP
jgi:hypothetical protein